MRMIFSKHHIGKLLKGIYTAIPISYKKKLFFKKKFVRYFSSLAYAANINDEYAELRSELILSKEKMLSLVPSKPLKMIQLESSQLSNATKHLVFNCASNPKVSILIPVYNNIKLTLECLLSIKENSGNIDYEIILVDDASQDETHHLLSDIKGIIYLRNKKNMGFLRSCNLGLEHANGEYFIFLNNDVQVTKNWLESLLQTFTLFPDTGAVGPKVLSPNGKLQEAGAKIRFDGTTQLIGQFDDPNKVNYTYIREVDYCSACCLMAKTELLKSLGGFDLAYTPAYSEDVDLCLRIQQQQLKIRYNPHSVIIHHLNATMNTVQKKNKLESSARNQQKLTLAWQSEIDQLNTIKFIADLNFTYNTSLKNEIALAKRFGIFGFSLQIDTRTISELHDQILSFSKLNFPFCFSLHYSDFKNLFSEETFYKKIVSLLDLSQYIKINQTPLIIIDTSNSLVSFKEIATLNKILFGFKITEDLSKDILLGNQDFIVISTLKPTLPPDSPTSSGNIKWCSEFILSQNAHRSVFRTLSNVTPGFYQAWLEEEIAYTLDQRGKNERIIFIGEWNAISKDKQYEYLNAIKNASDQRYLLG